MPDRVHRVIVAIAVWEWIALATGAVQSSSRIALDVPLLVTTHVALAWGGLLAVFGLCFWAKHARTALWIAFASVLLSCGTGWIAPASPGRIVWHAVFSHLAVALITVAAVVTSASWPQPPSGITSGPRDAVRLAAQWTPPTVLLQITLGALYRHQILGVLWHMLGAMIVAILALVVSVTLIQHFGDQPQLKGAAIALMTVVLVQVCLGIAVFLLVLLGAGNTLAFLWISTGHVCVGSFTFIAGVVAAMQARRCLAPANLS